MIMKRRHIYVNGGEILKGFTWQMSQKGGPRNHFSLSAPWQEVWWLLLCTIEIILHFSEGHKATLLIKTNKCQPHPLDVPHKAHTN